MQLPSHQIKLMLEQYAAIVRQIRAPASLSTVSLQSTHSLKLTYVARSSGGCWQGHVCVSTKPQVGLTLPVRVLPLLQWKRRPLGV